MRIAHVTNSLRADGTGITNVVVDLAWAQAGAGHDVRVLCRTSDAATDELLGRRGVDVERCVDLSRLRRIPHTVAATRRALRDVDVVHVHTVRAVLAVALARPGLFLRRSVATLHNPYQRSVPVMYLAHAVVSISRVDAAAVRRRTRGLRRPQVVHNGLVGSPRLVAADAVVSAPLEPPAIVYCGALYDRKGVDVLLTAMVTVRERVPDAHLHLIGNRDNPTLERLAAELGLGDAVTFVGFARDPRPFMRAASVFVLPSRAEGFGNVLTEARSVGAPIVASRVGGIPEALDEGEAGVLVPPGDAPALAAALVDVLTDPDRRAELRARSLAGVERFSLAEASRRYLVLYRAVAGTAAGQPRSASARR